MSIILDVILTLIACIFFGLINTVLDADDIKRKIAENSGKRFAFYRAFYVGTFLILLYLLIDFTPDPRVIIYDIPYPHDLLLLLIQLLALTGFFWAILHMDLLEFFGISQIIRWAEGKWNNDDLEMKLVFIKEGPFKYMRHPVYFFTLIFLFARSYLDLQTLIFNLFALIYFMFCSFYDDRKYLSRYGDEFKDYMEKTPQIIPYKIFRGKN